MVIVIWHSLGSWSQQLRPDESSDLLDVVRNEPTVGQTLSKDSQGTLSPRICSSQGETPIWKMQEWDKMFYKACPSRPLRT